MYELGRFKADFPGLGLKLESEWVLGWIWMNLVLSSACSDAELAKRVSSWGGVSVRTGRLLDLKVGSSGSLEKSSSFFRDSDNSASSELAIVLGF